MTLPLSLTQFRLVTDALDDETIDLVGRRLYLFFELIESARAIVNEIGDSDRSPLYAGLRFLRDLTIVSSPDITLQIAERRRLPSRTPLSAVLLSVKVLIDKRLVWYQGSTEKHIADQNQRRIRQEELRTEQEEQALRIARAEAEVRKGRRGSRESKARVKADILQGLRKRLPDRKLSPEMVDLIFEKEMAPLLEKLAQTGVTEIQVSE